MKLNIMLLMMTLSVSCCINQKVVCTDFSETEFEPAMSCQTNFEYMKCKCNCYNYNEYKSIDWKYCQEYEEGVIAHDLDDIGKEPRYLPITECHEIQGVLPVKFADQKAKSKKRIDLYKNLCKKK